MLTNFHTHTKRCLHAYGTEEDYIKAAVSEGLVMLGFSDHAPFPDYDFGMRMPYSELDDYISTLDILKEKYKNKIKLFRGLEIEYHAKYLDYYHSLLDEKGFDYLALGQHIYIQRLRAEWIISFPQARLRIISYMQKPSVKR